MFLPQRPYLSIGTLRDQVIYPDGEPEMHDRGRRDIELAQILEDARLGYLPDREGGWDTRKEWKDVLSGGEKQRMAIARLLYHEPRYAVLDEGTSAVSSDVEGYLYEKAKERGITLITISTRASLKKYHTFNLTLGLGEDGMGWEYERVGSAQQKMNVERELKELRERLARVPELEARRRVIEEELGSVWVQGGEEPEGPEKARQDDGETEVEEKSNDAISVGPDTENGSSSMVDVDMDNGSSSVATS